jgi:hypothetical protein
LRQFFAIESYNVYVPLIVDDVRISAEGVKDILNAEDASNLSWDRVADASLVEEVLRTR